MCRHVSWRLVMIFFFSSRRRHTRSLCDWSSDVCSSDLITEADVLAFQKAVADAPGPVLARCGSGTRSLTLYSIGEVLDRRMNPEDIRPFRERFGFELTVVERWIDRRGKRRPTFRGCIDRRTS